MQPVTQLIILWKKKLKEPINTYPVLEHTNMNSEEKKEREKGGFVNGGPGMWAI